jgi:hypothetical protein
MPDLSPTVLVWITVPFGLLLIATAMLDVFLTVLHTQAESPISNYLNRSFWALLRGVASPLPARIRDEILGWGAPLMISGILVFWTILYIVGFALLYVPFIHDPLVFVISDGEPGQPFDDALYFSAASFFTTGYGDITPQHTVARFLALAEGGLGLTTLSLSVTYLLSVYPLVSQKVSLAEALNQETGGRADGVVLAERYVKSGRYEALAQRLSAINDELLRLGQAHGLYPVLYYVRHREVHHGFVRVLVIAQGLVATLRYSLDREAYPEVVTDPRLLLLEEGLLSTLHMLASSSHLAPQRLTTEVATAARADYRALLAELRRRGIATVSPDDRQASERHARFRVATDQYIRGYAVNSGYNIADVHAVYSRWDRDTALVGHAELEDDEESDRMHADEVHTGGEALPPETAQELHAAASRYRGGQPSP